MGYNIKVAGIGVTCLPAGRLVTRSEISDRLGVRNKQELAQLVARSVRDAEIAGSNPVFLTMSS